MRTPITIEPKANAPATKRRRIGLLGSIATFSSGGPKMAKIENSPTNKTVRRMTRTLPRRMRERSASKEATRGPRSNGDSSFIIATTRTDFGYLPAKFSTFFALPYLMHQRLAPQATQQVLDRHLGHPAASLVCGAP